MNQQLKKEQNVAIDFDFEQWVNQNELQTVKNLFIKHGAITSSKLSVNSSNFQSLMTDTELYAKGHVIPKIITAVHELALIVSLFSMFSLFLSFSVHIVITQNSILSLIDFG